MTPSPTRHATEQWYPVTPSSFETSTFHNGTTSKFPHGFHKISSLSPFLSSLQINTPQGHCPEFMIFCIVTLIRTSLPLWHCHSYIADTLHIVFMGWTLTGRALRSVYLHHTDNRRYDMDIYQNFFTFYPYWELQHSSFSFFCFPPFWHPSQHPALLDCWPVWQTFLQTRLEKGKIAVTQMNTRHFHYTLSSFTSFTLRHTTHCLHSL